MIQHKQERKILPRYTYHCNDCEKSFEVRHSFNEIHDICNSCGKSGTLNKVITQVFVANNKKEDTEIKPGQVVKESIEEARKDLQRDKEILSSRKYKK
jgi:putative FmdB family regulatory protein